MQERGWGLLGVEDDPQRCDCGRAGWTGGREAEGERLGKRMGSWEWRGPALISGSLTLPLQVASAPLQMPQQPVRAGVEEEGLLLVDRLGLLRPLDTDGPGLRPVTIPDAQLGVKHHELLAVQGKLGHRHRYIVRAQLAAQQALHGEGAWGAHTRMSPTQERGTGRPLLPQTRDPGSQPRKPPSHLRLELGALGGRASAGFACQWSLSPSTRTPGFPRPTRRRAQPARAGYCSSGTAGARASPKPRKQGSPRRGSTRQ